MSRGLDQSRTLVICSRRALDLPPWRSHSITLTDIWIRVCLFLKEQSSDCGVGTEVQGQRTAQQEGQRGTCRTFMTKTLNMAFKVIKPNLSIPLAQHILTMLLVYEPPRRPSFFSLSI